MSFLPRSLARLLAHAGWYEKAPMFDVLENVNPNLGNRFRESKCAELPRMAASK